MSAGRPAGEAEREEEMSTEAEKAAKDAARVVALESGHGNVARSKGVVD